MVKYFFIFVTLLGFCFSSVTNNMVEAGLIETKGELSAYRNYNYNYYELCKSYKDREDSQKFEVYFLRTTCALLIGGAIGYTSSGVVATIAVSATIGAISYYFWDHK